MSYLFKHVKIIQPFRMLHKACFAKKLTHPTAYSHVLMPLLLSLACVLRWPRTTVGGSVELWHELRQVCQRGGGGGHHRPQHRQVQVHPTQPNPNQTKLYMSLTVLMRHGQVQKHPNLTKLNLYLSFVINRPSHGQVQVYSNQTKLLVFHKPSHGQDRCTLHKPILLFILDQ